MQRIHSHIIFSKASREFPLIQFFSISLYTLAIDENWAFVVVQIGTASLPNFLSVFMMFQFRPISKYLEEEKP